MKLNNLVYLKKIKEFRKKYYRDENIFSKNFYKNYCEFRKYIKKKVKQKMISKEKNFQEKDQVLNNLMSFEKKVNKNYLLNLIKKFEINLIIRKSYDRNFKKKTNLETNIISYIIFGLLIYDLKEINKIQKLNIILKLNDYLSYRFLIHKINHTKKFKDNFLKLISFEEKLIKNYDK